MEKYENQNYYMVLNTSKETIDNLENEEARKIFLKSKRDILDREYEAIYEKSNDPIEKKELLEKIKILSTAYRILSNSDSRETYDMARQNARIKKKYSHIAEIDENLIDYGVSADDKKERLIAKKLTKNAQEYSYRDKEGKLIMIRETATIGYKNWGKSDLFLHEYEVKRLANEKVLSDKIYTDLLIPELSKKSSTGELLNPEYFDCVINQLLSEESIEGSKHNFGFIGLVKKNKDGKYETTLDKEKLSSREQEMLTAIALLRNREVKEEDKKQIETEGNER